MTTTTVKDVSWAELMRTEHEGLACIGCEPVDEWVTEMNVWAKNEGVTTSDNIFTRVLKCVCRPYGMEGAMTVLVFMFPENTDDFSVGKLAIRRLAHSDWMKWLSDFQDHHRAGGEE